MAFEGSVSVKTSKQSWAHEDPPLSLATAQLRTADEEEAAAVVQQEWLVAAIRGADAQRRAKEAKEEAHEALEAARAKAAEAERLEKEAEDDEEIYDKIGRGGPQRGPHGGSAARVSRRRGWLRAAEL